MAKARLPLKVLVLDVLKPHQPSIVKLGSSMCEEESLDSVNITVYAVDEKTESVKMILEGENLNFEKIMEVIEKNGAAVHSMDKVILGRLPAIDQVAVKSKLKFST